jgi:micrococcal nuclease
MRARLLLAVGLLLVQVVLAQQEPLGTLFGPVPVIEVIDGDTVILESNLGPRIVRLIGIDTPEVQHPEKGREPFGPEASAFTTGLLPPGTQVWLEIDLEIEDAYGRLLAYLYYPDEAGSWRIGTQSVTMANLVIAEQGYAQPLVIEPNDLYADLIEDAVAEAQAAERGMWSPEATAAATGTETAMTSPTDPFPGLPPGPIVIACTLYNPTAELDFNSETVTLWLREPMDTRGYYLHDRGSGTRLSLPVGEHGPGELVILNPGQGIWNNGGDTIYLMHRDGTEIDSWDYTSQRTDEGKEICRNSP